MPVGWLEPGLFVVVGVGPASVVVDQEVVGLDGIDDPAASLVVVVANGLYVVVWTVASLMK